MKYKTAFRLALKFLGVYLIFGHLSPFVMYGIGWIREEPGYVGTQPLFPATFLIQPGIGMALGLYLFFGGRWIVNLAIPSNRPYCHECGYELTAATVDCCPECGTAFRLEDAQPPGAK